ncbi:isochorismatase family protein [Actinophytocola algeriensis]|uniref:Nicotinamidase-related amidase n=1 Tax=Actinophytocola algeriensis TaxID=1768010 RepID=A0A7W7Q9M0_9PSEU|nr:isochorismatase family protein [Actinophytocola algeriensis]MBB4909517.1 nicotinamidase-related amidase [Actinophytocola algeriensis]MBE1475507.1 nicotinamidase-related amidase [Actinophytocola algeriensis]
MAVWDEFVPPGELARLRDRGFGGPVEFGERPALLVVDVTLSFLSTDYPTGCGQAGWDRLPAIVKLVDHARALGIPRVFTCGSAPDAVFVGGAVKLSSDPEIARRVHGAPFPAELAARDDEYVLSKAKASAFFGTPLPTYLTQRGVDTLVVCGTTTSGCVRATVVDAASYGFRVLVAEDACFDRSPFAHAANLFDIQLKYGSVVDTARATELMGLP